MAFNILKKDPFGNYVVLKKLLISLIGFLSYPRYNFLNRIKYKGVENLKDLDERNVLFVSNHETYFAEVIAMYHLFCRVRTGFKNDLSNPLYLLKPRSNIYFIAAQETMKAGLLPKIFAYAGSVSIKRTWREAGTDVNRKVEIKDITNIGKALSNGWVITFPQGTTKPFAKGRRGTAHIIKKYKPVVIPVVIDGFRETFDKKGLIAKKRGIPLTVTFKEALNIDYNIESDEMLNQLMVAIEQTEEFQEPGANIAP
jgi:1-acyl-sn-glycerol-3-phosphate acyltransferase